MFGELSQGQISVEKCRGNSVREPLKLQPYQLQRRQDLLGLLLHKMLNMNYVIL